MFILVSYKDAPELSTMRRRSSDTDLSLEKTLLVNPYCPVRIMLEYIRKKCKLGTFTNFDLCDESGALKGLFDLPTHEYATDLFEHKKTYYIIVLRTEGEKRISVLPQLNWENRIYQELKARVKRFMTTGEVSPLPSTVGGKITPPGKKTPPSKTSSPMKKK